jgi:transcriptional regulator
LVYLPPHFAETRPEVLAAHLDRHDFALLVSHGRAGLIASHIPVMVERHGPALHLVGHLARPNPQLGDLVDGAEVLTIFAGPHAYISPRWYEAGPAVPTWNYADVHVYGRVRPVEDKDWLRALLRRLSDRHETGSPAPWRMQDLPEPYLQRMLNGIVGLDIEIDHLEGKFKLSQNRPAGDRPRIVAALEARGDDDALGVARLMRDRLAD